MSWKTPEQVSTLSYVLIEIATFSRQPTDNTCWDRHKNATPEFWTLAYEEFILQHDMERGGMDIVWIPFSLIAYFEV